MIRLIGISNDEICALWEMLAAVSSWLPCKHTKMKTVTCIFLFFTGDKFALSKPQKNVHRVLGKKSADASQLVDREGGGNGCQ
jgi:hypothetical protein